MARAKPDNAELNPTRNFGAEADYEQRGLDAPAINAVAPVPEPQLDAKDIKALQKAVQAALDTTTRGAPGTANFQGFIRHTGEYLPKFVGWHAMHVYEEMRRSDPTIQAAESAIKLPILAADWDVVPAEDPSASGQKKGSKVGSNGAGKATEAKAKEIAEFVKQNLQELESPTLRGTWNTQSFSSVREQSLLSVIFGCFAHEICWHSDADKNRIRIRRFFPLMPRTYYRFFVEPDGDTLTDLVQYGFRGPRYIIDKVPAEKIDVFVVNREAGNWYGRSPFRAAYMPWWFKHQFLPIIGLQAQRNAVGIPVITQGPNADEDDVILSQQWGKNLSANERTNLSLPNGWTFALASPSGRPLDLSGYLQYCDEQILDAVLAGFIALGKQQTGTRSVGDVKLQFFLLSEESLTANLNETMTGGSIRRLVDYNFRSSPADEIPYPRLTTQRIVMLNPQDIVTAIAALAKYDVKWMMPTKERDNWLSEQLGIPQRQEDDEPYILWAPITQRVETMEPATETPEELEQDKAPKSPGGQELNQGPGGRGQGPGSSQLSPGAQRQQAEQLQKRVQAGFADRRPWQPKQPFEKHFDYAAHRKREDIATTQVARILRRARPQVVQAVARQASRLGVQQLGHVAAPYDHQLAASVQKSLDRAVKFGRDQVSAEFERQTGKKGPEVRGQGSGAALAGVTRVGKGSKAVDRGFDARLFAQAAVTDLNNWANRAAAGAAVDLAKDGVSGKDLEDGIAEALLSSPDGFIDRIAAEAGRAAVFGGRMQGMEGLQDHIVRIVRREVMDGNTCAPCSEGDGTEWDSWDDVDWVRGDDCEGGDACRGDAIPEFETGLVAA